MNEFLHFRAGRMTYKNNLVTPETERGVLSFCSKGNDVEMSWSSHTTRQSFLLPKGQTKVSFVEKCTTGRVLLFEVDSESKSTNMHFFWLQDKNTSEDAEYLAVLTTALKAKKPAMKMSDLKQILQRIPKKESDEIEVTLERIIYSPSAMEAIKSDTEFFLDRLRPLLPEDNRSTLMQQIKNAQMSSGIRTLERAVNDDGAIKEVCSSYNLPVSNRKGVLAFVNAIIKALNK